MDKFDRFIEDIIFKSKSRTLRWSVWIAEYVETWIRKDANITEIFFCQKSEHPDDKLFLVQKTIPYDGSWGDGPDPTEEDPEIIIVRNGVKILSINGDLVDRSRIYDLLNFVRLENEDVSDFLKDYS